MGGNASSHMGRSAQLPLVKASPASFSLQLREGEPAHVGTDALN